MMVHHSDTHWGNVAAGALLFGLSLLGGGIWGVLRSAPTTSWPSTEGVIQESRIEDGLDSPDEPRIRYSYSVDGNPYMGKRIRYMLVISDGATQRLMSQYPQGAQVRVYYDPQRPDRAVLQAGGVVTGVVFLTTGLVLLALWRYALRRAK